MGNFVTDGQALHVGLILGELLKNGVQVRPVLDDDGNYTPVMLIKVDLGESPLRMKPEFVDVAVEVLP